MPSGILPQMPNIAFVDENDEVIGEGTKAEAWEKGAIHRIVRVFLYNSAGELLIQKRADHLPAGPGLWGEATAGHVDAGETYLEAAKRELVEEIGVEDVELTEVAKFFADTSGKTKIMKRFHMVYTGTYDGEVTPNPDEVAEVRWINPGELKKWIDERPDEFMSSTVRAFGLLSGD